MDSDSWTRLDRLFQEALVLTAAEREPFLARRAVYEPHLVAEVRAMLEVAAPGEELEIERQLLGQVTSDVWRTAPRDTGHLESGAEIGSYRVLDLVGTGGTAAVYRAERSDSQYEQVVAIKVVHAHLSASGLADRLRLERQILARLHHPHIAGLLDGGVLADGRPYLVMDYIEGQSILAHCDERRLTLAERLDLFCVVCRAVHYAHRNLIAHRDLKPSNILVTGDGQVRLLDFGIAKLLDADLTSSSATTRTVHRMLTPEYASPEQLLGDDLTTATDLYSLGLLLFEMLVGWQPQRGAACDLEGLPVWLDSDDPPRPSALSRRASERDGGELSTIAEQRGLSPQQLRRHLRGDLDSIVLQCLRRDPERRYSSAEELAEDLHRHQVGLPVRATAGSVLYRVGKFVRRHRVGVAVSVAFLLSLLSFAMAMLVQSRAVARERDAAREERDRANEVTELLIDLFSADPYAEEQRSRGDLSVREFLEASEDELSGGLDDQPALKASLLSLLGRLEGNLGDLDRARELTEEALAMRRQLYGEQHAEVADSLNGLGTVLQARGEYAEAEAAFRRALAVRTEVFGHEHLAVAESLNNLMVLLSVSGGSLEEQGELVSESLAIKRRLLGDDNLDVAQGLNNLAAFLWTRGRPGDIGRAEELYRQGLAIRERLLGKRHPSVAATRNNLAYLMHDRGRLEEAESLFRSAVDIWSTTLGPEHGQVAVGLTGLSAVLSERGDLVGAESALRRAIAIDSGKLPPDHPDIADGHLLLGQLLLRMERPREAIESVRRTVEIRTARFGAPDGRTLSAQVELAVCLEAAGDEVALDVLLEDLRQQAKAEALDDSDQRALEARLDRLFPKRRSHGSPG